LSLRSWRIAQRDGRGDEEFLPNPGNRENSRNNELQYIVFKDFFTDAPLPGFVYCRSIFERRRLFAGAGRSKYGRIAGERRSQNGTAPEPKRCFGGPSEVAYRVAEPPAIPALEQEGYCAGIRYGPSGYVFISSAAVRETVAATE
jgi:hypothetical protein